MILFPAPTIYASSGAFARPSFSRDFATTKLLNEGVGPAITFTRGSVGTFFDSAGTIQTADADTPRFDHDPATGVCLGLLIEGARTNLLLNSASLSTQNVTVSAVEQTISFYGTGSITLSGAHSATLNGAGAFPARASLTFTPSAGTLTVTVSGTVQNAQLENGPLATSWIATTGSAATRQADSATVATADSWYSQSAGTAVVEFRAATKTLLSSSSRRVLSFYDSGSNLILLAQNGTSDGGLFSATTGTTQWSIAVNNGNILTGAKMAAAWTANSAQMAFNGVLGTEDTSSSIPAATTMGIGRALASTTINVIRIQRMRVWNRRLSNASLEILSA